MRIAARFAGPPGSANGGIACGLLAQDTGGSEVTLRRPPPLETELTVKGHELYDGDVLIASSALTTVEVDDPGPVDLATAREAGIRGRDWSQPFPGCFSCGADREPPDAIALRLGPIGEGRTAAVWVPQDDSPVMVWAALDCPGGWAAGYPDRAMVLGRMALRLDALPVAGVEHVVQGWVIATDGRKVQTGSAVHDPQGRLLAVARATWFAVDPAEFGR